MKHLLILLSVLALTNCAGYGGGYDYSPRPARNYGTEMQAEATQRQMIRQELELREAMRTPPPPMCC